MIINDKMIYDNDFWMLSLFSIHLKPHISSGINEDNQDIRSNDSSALFFKKSGANLIKNGANRKKKFSLKDRKEKLKC